MQSGYDYARTLYVEGKYYDCLEACERILETNENDPATLNLIGLLCFRSGELEVAEAYFRECLKFDSRHAEAYSNLALILKRRGCLDEALEAYRRSVELNGQDGQVLFNYGLALQSIGNSEECANILRRAASLAPFLPDVHSTLGRQLMELGQIEEAVSSFRSALTVNPDALASYRNLAAALFRFGQPSAAMDVLRGGASVLGLAMLGQDLAAVAAETGKIVEAIIILRRMIDSKPGDAGVWETLGDLYYRSARFPEALASLQRAVKLDHRRPHAHMRIFEVGQILGQRTMALDHQRQALSQTRLFTELGSNPNLPQLLILKAAGDWQANLPTDFIIRREAWQAVHTYYLEGSAVPLAGDLPTADIVLSALGEADLLRPELAAAAALQDALNIPFLNPPKMIARTGRDVMAQFLAGIPDCIVPKTVKLATQTALASLTEMVANGHLTFPFLIRPTGTHCGEGMVLAEDPLHLERELACIAAEQIYAAQFVDYRSSDGFFRKYRVAMVGGQPLPYHLALSKRWMVHYYNADIDDRSVMDREEERYLAAFDTVFGERARRAIQEIDQRVGLDIYALDCALTPDGGLVLFEVAVNAIIHLMEDPATHAYKHRYVPRIFDAVQTLMKKRIAL